MTASNAVDIILFSWTGADAIEFTVSVPSEGENESNSERAHFSYRVERRYSEFASFNTVIDQLRSGVVRQLHGTATLSSRIGQHPLVR